MTDTEHSRAKLGVRGVEPIVGMRHAIELDSTSDKPELESSTFYNDSKHLTRGGGIVVTLHNIVGLHSVACVTQSSVLNSDSESRFT